MTTNSTSFAVVACVQWLGNHSINGQLTGESNGVY
jgi:hypothetical protein